MAIALVVNHAEIMPSFGAGFTTSGITTTGANLICFWVATNSGTTPTVSDNKSNIWTSINAPNTGSVLFYCLGPTVGAGHTFTVAGDNFTYYAIGVAAFSGVAASGALDKQSSNIVGFSLTIQPGSVTPSVDNELIFNAWGWGFDVVVSSLSIDSGQTILDKIFNSSGGGSHENIGTAYEIQTTATARNPTWTSNDNGAGSIVCSIATFKAAAAGAACVPTRTLLGVGCGIQAVRAMIRNRVVQRRGIIAELLGVSDE